MLAMSAARTRTAAEERDAIVAHLVAQGGWVPVAQLVRWMRQELGQLTVDAGQRDLRTLVLEGRIERRPTREDATWLRGYEYRAVTERAPTRTAECARLRTIAGAWRELAEARAAALESVGLWPADGPCRERLERAEQRLRELGELPTGRGRG